MTQATDDESAGAQAEMTEVVRLSLRVDVRERLAAEARRRDQRRLDVVLAAVREHEAELSEILDCYAGARPSALFGAIRSRADDQRTPTVVSSIVGMLRSPAQGSEQVRSECTRVRRPAAGPAAAPGAVSVLAAPRGIGAP